MFTQLNQLRDHCHNISLAAGWYRNYDGINISAQPPHSAAEQEYVQGVACTQFALIHSEISEALEGYRKDKKDDHLPDLPAVDVELADALIRIFDLAGYLGCDLATAVERKMTYNATRKDHTKEAREAPGGKRF